MTLLLKTTPESFDIGVYGSFSPGLLGDAYNYLFGDESSPKFSAGADIGKLTIDAGVQWAGRGSLNGVGADLYAGIGAWGATANFDANYNGSGLPSGITLNYGPQSESIGSDTIEIFTDYEHGRAE